MSAPLQRLAALPCAAWLVGGALRDELLGRPTCDFDIAIDGDPKRVATDLARHSDAHPFSLSDAFGAWRVVARDHSWQIDLMPLLGASIEADLARRDLTINAIARDLATGEVFDPFGGRDDLAARRLRMVEPSAFRDDPLRVMRLVRLAAELEFDVDAQTGAAAAAAAPGLRSVAAERVFMELRLLVCGPRPAPALAMMERVGATDVVLPELSALHGVTQSDYHHLDVHDHTIAVLERTIELARAPGEVFAGVEPDLTRVLDEPLANEMTRREALRFGALLHDVAKPATRAVTPEGRVTFMRHDELGVTLAGDALRRLRASDRLIVFVQGLVRRHLTLGFLVHDVPLSRRAVYRYLAACEPVEVEVTLLSVGDRLATRGRGSEVAIAHHLALAREMMGMRCAGERSGPGRRSAVIASPKHSVCARDRSSGNCSPSSRRPPSPARSPARTRRSAMHASCSPGTGPTRDRPALGELRVAHARLLPGSARFRRGSLVVCRVDLRDRPQPVRTSTMTTNTNRPRLDPAQRDAIRRELAMIASESGDLELCLRHGDRAAFLRLQAKLADHGRVLNAIGSTDSDEAVPEGDADAELRSRAASMADQIAAIVGQSESVDVDSALDALAELRTLAGEPVVAAPERRHRRTRRWVTVALFLQVLFVSVLAWTRLAAVDYAQAIGSGQYLFEVALAPGLLAFGIYFNEKIRALNVRWLEWSPFHVRANVSLMPVESRFWLPYSALLAFCIPLLAFLEEYIFRYGTTTWVRGILWGGLAFGFLHLFSLVSIRMAIYLTLVGLVFVEVYMTYGLLAVFVLHASYNLLALGSALMQKLLGSGGLPSVSPTGAVARHGT